jgi:hypothetical protein
MFFNKGVKSSQVLGGNEGSGKECQDEEECRLEHGCGGFG